MHHPSGVRLRISGYDLKPYAGRLTLFRTAGRRTEPTADPSYGWAGVARDGLTLHTVPGDHLSMFLEPNVEVLADKLAAELEAADGVAQGGHTLTEGIG